MPALCTYLDPHPLALTLELGQKNNIKASALVCALLPIPPQKALMVGDIQAVDVY